MVDSVKPPRYRTDIHPKTGEYAAKDTKTGELLDIADCVRLLNRMKGLDNADTTV